MLLAMHIGMISISIVRSSRLYWGWSVIGRLSRAVSARSRIRCICQAVTFDQPT